jgi:hypothetical protein
VIIKKLKLIRKIMASPGFAVSKARYASNAAAAAAAALMPADLRER